MSSAETLQHRLDSVRKELLELSTRNRLLNTPRHRKRSRGIEIVDEISEEIYKILVQDKKGMTFLPITKQLEEAMKKKAEKEQNSEQKQEAEKKEESASAAKLKEDSKSKSDSGIKSSSDSDRSDPDNNDAEKSEHRIEIPLIGLSLSQPEDDEIDSEGVAKRHTDSRLQTLLKSEDLQKRLLSNFYDARSFAEEQGVNILYLAMGFLKWFDQNAPETERYAPLLLIPVVLERQSARTRFRIRYLDEELSTNLSLQAKLKVDFALDLPDVPDYEDLSPNEYFSQVNEVVSGMKGWEVLPNDMVLWFFSFSKFLMYRDLDLSLWPENRPLSDHPLLLKLLTTGFADEEPEQDLEENLDELIPPEELIHIMNADASQTLAIEEAKRGRNLIIQGPPGTGKSQTITNLIAAAVQAGKKVLFVAEKMAALEVVKRRLTNIGLGDLCLELHSHKASKKTVLNDLAGTLKLGCPTVDEDYETVVEELAEVKQTLNRYVDALHTPIEPCELTPHQVLGHLIRLRSNNVTPPDFSLEKPEEWDRKTFRDRSELLQQLIEHLEVMGQPSEHPWRGVQRESMLPTDVERFNTTLPTVSEEIEQTQQEVTELARSLSMEPALSMAGIEGQLNLAQLICEIPTLDAETLQSPVWQTHTRQIDEIVTLGANLEETREKLSTVVSDIAWETDVKEARVALATHGTSWFRWFRSSYRAACRTLKAICIGKPPKPLLERMNLLDDLMAAQKAVRELGEKNDLGQQAFGPFWNRDRSDWKEVSVIHQWQKSMAESDVPVDLKTLLENKPDAKEVEQQKNSVHETFNRLKSSLLNQFDQIKLDLPMAFGVSTDENAIATVPLDTIQERLKQWREEPDRISNWMNYFRFKQQLDTQGLQDVTVRIHDGRLTAKDAQLQFQLAYYESLIRHIFEKMPDLAQFDGRSFEQLQEKFRDLDVKRIQIARQQVARCHYDQMPKQQAVVGELGLLRREINKKRRHLPIRKLLKEAGQAIQQIKPVFMMSPMSIAQFLEPGGLEFDLMLMDEASQVRPVDALGAIARSKQIVVVGDDKQLPPTQFFSTVLSDTEDLDDEEFFTGDLESVLGLCLAQNVPQRMLRWHYRSRHQSLIAVSNREFYDDQLFVFPSPRLQSDELGVCFHFIEEGVFDRGGSASNRVEAKIVAEAVMEHARNHPDLTLGVGAFSMSQRNVILDELEKMRREDSSAESFFATGGPEPFFVKNLESIQGDERDVIFISVGYARDREGKLSMNFGPLSNEGGERRLNVLITRSRLCCEVFSSIRSADIDTKRATGRGPAALKAYLHFAETGDIEIHRHASEEESSPLEDHVADILTENGYHVERQVGIAGLFVDVAVQSAPDQDGYLAGLESDGVGYHAIRSVRDRDRTRPGVMGHYGWMSKRLWSPDWYYRPDEQMKQLLDLLQELKEEEHRKLESNGDAASSSSDDSEKEEQKEEPSEEKTETEEKHQSEQKQGLGNIERTEVDPAETESEIPIVPYNEASFRAPKKTKPLNKIAAEDLKKYVLDVVDDEGPIHIEELTRRLVSLWETRSSSTITEKIGLALDLLMMDDSVKQKGDFYSPTSLTEIPLRDRSEVESSSLKKGEMIPPEEIQGALRIIITNNFGVTEEEAIKESSRLLGFQVATSSLKETFGEHLKELISSGEVTLKEEKLYPAAST